MDGIFLYGTLCYKPLLNLVLGGEQRFTCHETFLKNHEIRWVKNADYPAIYPAENVSAHGVLLTGITPEQCARMDFYEATFGYVLRDIFVEHLGQRISAKAYFPRKRPVPGRGWSIEDWAETCWPVTRHFAAELMGYFGQFSPEELAERIGMIGTRAASRVRACTSPAPTAIRTDNGRDQVRVIEHNQPYSGFFTIEQFRLSYRRFDAEMSTEVERMGFVGGDAAIVLPYDPKTDLVMVIEQFRYGPYLRHDVHPWVLEPIAGRIDKGESPESCARRETHEEAGLELRSLEHVSDYYPSPGTSSEFFYTYIGLSDLNVEMAGIGGLAEEAEDIRSHVITFDRLMELVSSGEAGCGPLVLCALWLSVNRPRLRRLA